MIILNSILLVTIAILWILVGIVILSDTKVKTEEVKIVKIHKTKVIVKYKKDIIDSVATDTELSKYKSSKILNTILDEIREQLVEGNIVNIKQFGKFKKYRVKEHAGVNPGTGESIVIEAHNRIKFFASKQLKQLFVGQEPDFSKKEYITTEIVNKIEESTPVEPIVKETKEVIIPVEAKTQEVESVKISKNKVIVRYKKDIIDSVATDTELSKYKSSKILNTILDEIREQLVEGNIVNIKQFGKFKKYRVKEHAGVNPGTGEGIVIEAHNRIKFSASSQLKQLFIDQAPDFTKKEYIPVLKKIEELPKEEKKVEESVVEKVKKPKIKVIVKYKKDIIDYVAADTELSKYKSSKILNAILDEIREQLVEGNVVNIKQFGKFKKYHVHEHAGVNPGTGEGIVIKAHNRIRYVPSKDLKSKLNE